MAYQIADLGNGREEVRCRYYGRLTHIVCRSENEWIVEEDEQGRVFPNRQMALDRARQIGQDPDYPAEVPS